MISRDTFDWTNHYKQLRFHEGRILCDNELNELQQTLIFDLMSLFNHMFGAISVLSGFGVTITGTINIAEGFIAWNGKMIRIDPFAFALPVPKNIYVTVYKTNIDATEDVTLKDEDTLEPIAEREQWGATLGTSAAPSNPPEWYDATTVLLMTVAAGPTVTWGIPGAFSAATKAAIDAHIGAGGGAHANATTVTAGFMSAADKVALAAAATDLVAHNLHPEAHNNHPYFRLNDLLFLYNVKVRFGSAKFNLITFNAAENWTWEGVTYNGPQARGSKLSYAGELTHHIESAAVSTVCWEIAFRTHDTTPGTLYIPVLYADDQVRVFYGNTYADWLTYTQAQIAGATPVADPKFGVYMHLGSFAIPVVPNQTYFLSVLLTDSAGSRQGLWLGSYLEHVHNYVGVPWNHDARPEF